MNKAEFLNGLKKSLSDTFNSEQVNTSVSFYINYINEEIAKGRDEEEVVDELGDPRLIAKTIKTVKGNEVAFDSEEREDANRRNNEESKNKTKGNKTVYYAGNTSVIGCFIVFLVLFIIVMSIFRFLGYILVGTAGVVFGIGPISLLIILFIIYLLTKK